MSGFVIPLPSRERVQQLLDYDPNTGLFHWKEKTSSGHSIYTIAGGSVSFQIVINGTAYLKHRLAWLHYYGEPVPDEIDHKDMDRRNNAITNLRAATTSQNQANTGLRKDNKTGVKGVHYHKTKKKFGVAIGYTHYGYFDSLEEAKEVRQRIFAKQYNEFARHG